MNSIRSSC